MGDLLVITLFFGEVGGQTKNLSVCLAWWKHSDYVAQCGHKLNLHLTPFSNLKLELVSIMLDFLLDVNKFVLIPLSNLLTQSTPITLQSV